MKITDLKFTRKFVLICMLLACYAVALQPSTSNAWDDGGGGCIAVYPSPCDLPGGGNPWPGGNNS